MTSQSLVHGASFRDGSDAQPELITHQTQESKIMEKFYPSAGLAASGYRCTMYSPEEWTESNDALLLQAANDRDEAQKVRHESKAAQMETESVTLRRQADGTRHLGRRLQDIHFWKSELQQHIDQTAAATGSLVALKRRLEKALDASETPFRIAADNLSWRERRLGPDMVKDNVDEELLKEVELIRNVQSLLRRTLTQTVDQIRANREAKKSLELDWSDKCQAYSMDEQCGRYSNGSTDTQQHRSSAKLQQHVSDRVTWARFTQDNLAQVQRELQASAELQLLSERVLQETAEDLQAQCAAVDAAFAHRCQEVSEAKVAMELHLTQILEQIGAQERNIAMLQQALRDKEAPQRVAQTRLHQRAQRPNVELCQDESQLSLVAEAGEIELTVETLQRQLAESQRSLRHLEDTRVALEKASATKAHSLLVDREMCVSHRSRYPPASTLAGY
ncbi:tektin-4 [Brienomyrus brachyistius]|uniref:tektin-4 n=1 Tax=Brienomyrus brachyistius TaxID=42636 RepID=UPI0020B3B301|nr:tektin-4 [Brienomyrus brachyistius]